MEFITTVGNKRVDKSAFGHYMVSDIDGANGVPYPTAQEAINAARDAAGLELIPRLRIVPAPITGIGWYAVQRYSVPRGVYEHVSTFRGEATAQEFIDMEAARRTARGL